jgi:hypothetical protein
MTTLAEERPANLEILGELVDTADNYLEYGVGGGMSGLPPGMRIDAPTNGLKAIRKEIKALYIVEGGEDRWSKYE